MAQEDPIEKKPTDATNNPALQNDGKTPTEASAPTAASKTQVIGILILFVVIIAFVGYLLFGDDGKRQSVEAVKATIKEGVFDIPDSKVTEYERFRENVSRQIDDMQRKVDTQVSLTDAREKEIRDLRQLLQESTALSGTSAEKTAEVDLSLLSDSMRSLFPRAVEEMERLAIDTGNINYLDVLPSFNHWVRRQVQTSTDIEIELLAKTAQVRRKPITDAQYLAVPEIAQRRAALGLPAENIPAITKMIWSRRANLPPMTAGQMVGMAHLASLTTVDAPRSQQDVNAIHSPAAVPQAGANAWQKAAAGMSSLTSTMHLGPITARTDAVQLAVKALLPTLTEQIIGGSLANDRSIKGATYAIGLSDARVTNAQQVNNNYDGIIALLLLSEGDIQTGINLNLSVDVKDPRAASVGVDQMVALRAVTVAATAVQVALNATEPVLDMAAVEGLLRSPSPDLISIALSNDSKTDQYIFNLIDVALKKSGDGRGGFPQSARTIRALAISHQNNIDAHAKKLASLGVDAVVIQQFKKVALVVAATPYATSTLGGEAKRQKENASRSVAQLATWLGASDLVRAEIVQHRIKQYAANYLTLNIDWPLLTTKLSDQTRQIAAEAAAGALLQGDTPEVVAAAIEAIRRTSIPVALAVINQAVVKNIVMVSIAEAAIGKDAITVDSVHEYLQAQVERMVDSTYTDENIRVTAGSISRDCIAILTGKRNLPRRRIDHSQQTNVEQDLSSGGAVTTGTTIVSPPSRLPPTQTGTYNATNYEGPNGERRTSQELRVVSFASGTPVPQGTTRPMAGPANLGTSVVTLQSGTYGEAYLYSGVEISTTGTIKRTVLINLSHTWTGTGSSVRMRDMKILADASPLPGATNRLILDLKRLSFRFPSGMIVERECQGYVVDGVEGRDGIIAEYRLNLEELGPLAAGSGFFKGLGTALENITRPSAGTTSVTVNNSPSTTTSNDIPGSIWAAGAVSGAADPIAAYTTRAMGAVSPTIVAQNGQPVTVVLTMPVVFDGVAATEWKSISGSAVAESGLFK